MNENMKLRMCKFLNNKTCEIYIGIHDISNFDDIARMFGKFLEKLSCKAVDYKLYRTIIYLDVVNRDVYNYVYSYWRGINYNITLPMIDKDIIFEEIYDNENIRNGINNYFIRYYKDNITNTIKLYINIFNISCRDEEIYSLLCEELTKLNKYIRCENVSCDNKCDNKNVIIPQTGKLFYTDDSKTIEGLSIMNKSHSRNINEIPLCSVCRDNLLKQDCYLCLEQFDIKSNIVYKCDNINHAVHSNCDKEHQDTIIKNTNETTYTSNLNGLINCGYCRQQHNKYFNKEKYKRRMNIIEVYDDDEFETNNNPTNMTREELLIMREINRLINS